MPTVTSPCWAVEGRSARRKTSGVAAPSSSPRYFFLSFLPLFHSLVLGECRFDNLGGCAGSQALREGHNLADPRAERSLVVWGLAKRAGPDGGFWGGRRKAHWQVASAPPPLKFGTFSDPGSVGLGGRCGVFPGTLFLKKTLGARRLCGGPHTSA